MVETAIAAGKDFNIYAQNDGMARSCPGTRGGRDQPWEGRVKTVGFDFNRFALRNVQAGYWDADMQCNPVGQQIDQ